MDIASSDPSDNRLGDVLGASLATASTAPCAPDGVVDVAWTVLEGHGGKAAPAKQFGIGPDGAPIVTGAGAQPSSGVFMRRDVRGTSGEILAELGTCISSMSCRQALILVPSVSGKAVEEFTTKAEAQGRDGIAYRGNRDFVPVRGAALLGLDFDLKAWPEGLRRKVERTAGGLIGALNRAWNGFSEVAYLKRASSSAGIRNKETDLETPPNAGVHIFVVVRNGEDIPRFVGILNKRLIAEGFGWAFIDKTGGVEIRSIIDERASNSLSRLWYEGAAILDDPRLEFVKDGRLATVHNVEAHFLDTAALQMPRDPDDPVWFATATAMTRLQDEAAPEAAVIRREYKERRVAEIVAAGGSEEGARKAVRLAVEKRTLSGDFLIRFDGGLIASVSEILADRAAFHRKTCADPLEWDYGSGENLGVCYTDGEPHIFSQAHGGRDFRLGIDPADWYEELDSDSTLSALQVDGPAASAGSLFGADDSDLPPIPPVQPKRLRFESFEDVAKAAYAEGAKPLVRGLLDAGAMTVLYGESNSGKSFVALDLAYHIAIGRKWADLTVNAGAVVYIAAEGGRGIAKRVEALRLKYGSAPRLQFLRSTVDLLHANPDLEPLLGALVEMEELPALVIVDTLSRVMAGGEENSSVDMTHLIRNLDEIRQRTGAHLLVVHHAGKNKAKGARGHSSLRAATDTEIEIASGEIKVTKQRDIEKGFAASFALEPTTLGVTADDEPISTATVRLLGISSVAPASALVETETDRERKELIALAAFRAMDGKPTVGSTAIHDRLAEELGARALIKGTSPKTVQRAITDTLQGEGVEIETDGKPMRIIMRKSEGLANAPWMLSALSVPSDIQDNLSSRTNVGQNNVFG